MADPDQHDMFEQRIKIPAEKTQLRDWLIREGALQAILVEIKGSGLQLPGVIFCKALIDKTIAEIHRERSTEVYLAASRHGVNLHEITNISTEWEGGEVTLVVRTEGGAA